MQAVANHPRVNLVVALAALVLVGLAGVAWACTPHATLTPVGIASGPSGSLVPMAGKATTQEAVELRWDGVDGQLVGQVPVSEIDGGEFATEITVPEVDPGVYSIVAVNGDRGVARAAFEVTAGSAPPEPVDSEVALSTESGAEQSNQAGSASGQADTAPAPSVRSGGADLWSGLDEGDDAVLGSGVDEPVAAGESPGMQQPLMLALGLLGGGAFLLVGGGAVALHRRRVPVRATTTHTD